jgi:tRNA A-37 threonylcarbamoyl transferase component Bud32
MGNPLDGAVIRTLGGIVGAQDDGRPRGRTELAVDRVIDGRYRILQPIGAGGFSQVYLAQDTGLGREVALKVLDGDAAADSDLRRLFVKNAKSLAQLSHPNLVSIQAVGEVDGKPYIAMEHVSGPSLRERIERGGALPVSEAIRLATEIANGLGFAHSRGIIHADLKPSNVLLDQNDRPKITDFGIARTPEERADTPQLYATALYVAPERVEGKPASVAADIYGLGLVVYEMLVGRPPFTSSNPSVLLRDHVVRSPIPPSHLRPSLPKEIDSIVLRALAKDPALRYQRAGEMATELAKLENASAQVAAAPARGREMGRFIPEPIQGFMPAAEQSPVVALLSRYGQPIRNAFFGALAALPPFGLFVLAGFGAAPGVMAGGLVLALGVLGQVGVALTLAWMISTALLFLFSPGVALLFAFMGLFIWAREVPAERAALALAMPVLAPFGLAPALLLGSVAIHGLAGVFTVGWGAVLTVVYAIASGKQALGPFVQTGLSLELETLFSQKRALESISAVLQLLQPSASQADRLAPAREQFEPTMLATQLGAFVSRLANADVSAIATVGSWVLAALAVWTITRLLRGIFVGLLRQSPRWFALYVLATATGVLAGAALLYMLFVTWGPLELAPARPADSVLMLSALTGALLAIASGVVIAATAPIEAEEQRSPAMAARRIPVR